jgi:mannose-1-phosphate guanylyltransferase/mannose-6-phosphate isomerase
LGESAALTLHGRRQPVFPGQSSIMDDLIPVLLAGGIGTRLWPTSRESYPKQLLTMAGERTLLQEAAVRARALAAPERVVTVTTEQHYFAVCDQLGDLDKGLAAHVIAEPAGRNTAAAVVLAALYAERAFGDAVLWVAAADHVIQRNEALMEAVRTAAALARQGRLVTFGIQPTEPSSEYGYIECGAALGADGARAVARFVEKPARAAAEAMLATGRCYWNSGIFVFRTSAFLEECGRTAPDVLAAAHAAFAATDAAKKPFRPARDAYAAIPSLPIDKAVMERSDKVAVVPVDLGWSDVGTWQRLWEVSAKDEGGNAVHGDVLIEGARDNLVRADSRLVALAGVEDLVVVETADAVLVAGKDANAGIKAIVDRLRAAGRPEATSHLTERRPWGTFSVLLEGPRYKIKEIMVKPGAALSLQMHHHRSEHWIVIEGTARVTCGEDVRILSENESTYIPLGQKHRLENPGRMPLRIVEVQSGGYLGEDDIVRFQDTYGRAG